MPLPWLVLGTLSVVGFAIAGFGAYHDLMPRVFTPAQKQRIESWEMARRWRAIPADRIFPAVIGYRLPGNQIGSIGVLRLSASRLEIARQATCQSAAGASRRIRLMLAEQGCQALLRATYADQTRSMVVTVGVAVLKSSAAAVRVAETMTKGTPGFQGALSRQSLLRPVPVPGGPAQVFALRQRQLSWVANAGPYLVIATVGYADGRPKVAITSDNYSYIEMTSLASGVVGTVVGPLGALPPVPRCPGAPGC